MMDDVLSLQRRGFLQVGAVVLATVAPGRAMAARSAGGSVVVYRADDAASVAFAAAMQVQQAARWRSSQGGQAQKTKRESLRRRAAGLHQADGTVAHSGQRRARGGRHGASICKGGAHK